MTAHPDSIKALHAQMCAVNPETPNLTSIYCTISKGEGRGLDIHTLVTGYLEAKLFMETTDNAERERLANTKPKKIMRPAGVEPA